MKKSLMNYFSFVLFLSVLATAFVACDKDDDDDDTAPIEDSKLTATVSGVGNQADSVYFVDYESGGTIAKAEFKNNQFTMVFPETLPSRYLESLSGEIPTGVTASDASAKVCLYTGFTTYKNGSYTGEIYYANYTYDDDEDYPVGAADVYFAYADRDVSVTGTYTSSSDKYKDTYNCNFKKGWNYFVEIYKGKSDGMDIYEYSTSLPGGLKWYFDPSGSYDYSSLAISSKRMKK